MLALRAISRRAPHALFTRSVTLPTAELMKDLIQGYPKDTTDNTNPLGPHVADLPPTVGPGGYTSPDQNPMSQENIKRQQLKFSGKYYRFDCHSTRNNTITTLSSLEYNRSNEHEPPKSRVIAWFSGGSVGFKKAQRAGYEAGYQCAVRVFKLLEDLKKNSDKAEVHLYFRGFGQGREALKAALMMSEGEEVRSMITTVTDRTALKIGGTRSKKRRRL